MRHPANKTTKLVDDKLIYSKIGQAGTLAGALSLGS